MVMLHKSATPMKPGYVLQAVTKNKKPQTSNCLYGYQFKRTTFFG
jgi:hypothetical protein